jgi:hypothetical protein
MSDSEPRFEAQPASLLGEGWCVHIFWEDEKPHIIPGFSNQYEALSWIKSNSANWVAAYILKSPKY